jgi:hypothetical protein
VKIESTIVLIANLEKGPLQKSLSKGFCMENQVDNYWSDEIWSYLHCIICDLSSQRLV